MKSFYVKPEENNLYLITREEDSYDVIGSITMFEDENDETSYVVESIRFHVDNEKDIIIMMLSIFYHVHGKTLKGSCDGETRSVLEDIGAHVNRDTNTFHFRKKDLKRESLFEVLKVTYHFDSPDEKFDFNIHVVANPIGGMYSLESFNEMGYMAEELTDMKYQNMRLHEHVEVGNVVLDWELPEWVENNKLYGELEMPNNENYIIEGNWKEILKFLVEDDYENELPRVRKMRITNINNGEENIILHYNNVREYVFIKE